MIYESRPRHVEIQDEGRMELENPRKQRAMLEQDADGWWANERLDDCTILGHGKTEEEALADLARRMASFVDFMKKAGRDVPKSLR